MKKMISLALACLLCLFAFAGCGGSTEAAPVPEAPSEAPAATEAPEAVVDMTASEIVAEIVAAVGEENLPGAMELDAEMLEAFYGLTAEDVADFSCRMPMMNVHATEICVIKAAEGKADAVSAGIDKRLADLEATWSQYLPEQYELVQNAKVIRNGDWFLLAVSETADTMEETFNGITKN